MTKDWDAVQDEIKELSFKQKKPLMEVKALIESKYKFKASTRAYRMKLKEWGLMRHKRRKLNHACNNNVDSDDSSTRQSSPELTPDATHLESDPLQICAIAPLPHLKQTESTDAPFDQMLLESSSLQLSMDPWAQARTRASEIVMNILDAILDNDATRLEQLLLGNVDHINDPIGLPFETPSSRFFNHPAMNQMMILQHPDQTLLDVACGMPCGPVIWILLAHGAKGSQHPLGTDLALHNAIKNGRKYTVQALIVPGRSDVNGLPGTSWRPLLQAVFWNHPGVTQILLKRGARMEDKGPSPNGTGQYTALQLCLHKRMMEYSEPSFRGRSNQTLKILLTEGANIHVAPPDGSNLSPFEMFIQPIQDTPYWATHMTPLEVDCLGLFISRGADTLSSFTGCLCGATSSNQTFAHQALWHSTPSIARLLIDSISAAPQRTGLSLLHEIVGSCPDAKRHPADTLRDIEVLHSAGVDFNLSDANGVTPLRKCIEQCPAVDLVDRLRVMLDAGADPEIQGPDGLQPYVLAARTFEGKLLSEVMELLVSKIQGRYSRVVGETSHRWDSTQFPISQDQTYEQVMSCARSTGDFRMRMGDMVPDDVHVAFNRAYFSAVSRNYLDTMTRVAQERSLKTNEKDEIQWVIGMRSTISLTPYKFDQEFVVALLHPLSLELLEIGTNGATPRAVPISSLIDLTSPEPTSSREPFQFNPNGSTLEVSPPAHKSKAEETSVDFGVEETAKIRWKDPTAKSKPGDLAKAVDAILQHKCSTCMDGNLLTNAELDKHRTEHEHTKTCSDAECTRRFCMREKRLGRR